LHRRVQSCDARAADMPTCASARYSRRPMQQRYIVGNHLFISTSVPTDLKYISR
jgi:hypothetical protein